MHHCSQTSANYRSIKRLTHSEIIKFLLQLVGDYRLNYFSWHQIFAFYCKFFFFNGTNLILLQKKDEHSFICQKRDLINSCLHAVGFVKKKWNRKIRVTYLVPSFCSGLFKWPWLFIIFTPRKFFTGVLSHSFQVL